MSIGKNIDENSPEFKLAYLRHEKEELEYLVTLLKSGLQKKMACITEAEVCSANMECKPTILYINYRTNLFWVKERNLILVLNIGLIALKSMFLMRIKEFFEQVREGVRYIVRLENLISVLKSELQKQRIEI